MATALITGASAGLGRALSLALAQRGWRLVVNARDPVRLEETRRMLDAITDITALQGDVTDPAHRRRLAEASGPELDLLVNNASTLGASPMPRVAALLPETLRKVLDTNVEAPHALTTSLLPALMRARGLVLNVSSDAAVEHYAGWGGYGASKAALDHLTLTLAAENPELAAYAVDPGDMRTAMHQRAFPGEDISDRPEPDTVVPGLLDLIERRPASGRYRVAELAAVIV